MPAPIRVLTAVPICDGHDSAINTINLEFIRHGIEVVYLGYHRYAKDMVRAAIQEDVGALGISSYNGGHVDFFAEVVKQLKKNGAETIKVFGGGGGTITHADQAVMKRKGVDKIFFAGTSLTEMVDFVRENYARSRKLSRNATADMKLARKLTEIEDTYADGKGKRPTSKRPTSNVEVGESAAWSHSGDWIYRSGRRGEDDVDRRTYSAPAAAEFEDADRDLVA